MLLQMRQSRSFLTHPQLSVALIKAVTVASDRQARVRMNSDSPFESTRIVCGSSRWLHQRPDRTETGRSPSPGALHHPVLWRNELSDLLVQGEGVLWAVMGHDSPPVPRNKWLSTHLIFLSFLGLLRFLTHQTAINHCQRRSDVI